MKPKTKPIREWTKSFENSCEKSESTSFASPSKSLHPSISHSISAFAKQVIPNTLNKNSLSRNTLLKCSFFKQKSWLQTCFSKTNFYPSSYSFAYTDCYWFEKKERCSLQRDCEEKVSPESDCASLDPKVSAINGIGFVGELQTRRTARTNRFFRQDRNQQLIHHVDRSTETDSWLLLQLVPVFRRRQKRRKQVQSMRKPYWWWDASSSWRRLHKHWTQIRDVSNSLIWQRRSTLNQESVFSSFLLKHKKQIRDRCNKNLPKKNKGCHRPWWWIHQRLVWSMLKEEE